MMSATAAAACPRTDAAHRLSVETVSDYQSFVELEAEWTRLLEQAAIPHPFLTHTWVQTWWECFGVGKRLHILVVRDAGEVIAIAPLMVSEGRMYGLKVRWLEFIYNSHTPRFDFIVARNQEEAYQAIWKSLIDQRDLWDAMRLCQLPAGSPTLDEMVRLAACSGFRMGLWPSGDSPVLPLHGSWEDYLKSVGRKHRSNLRNRTKRLNEAGDVRMEEITVAREARAALEEGLRIEALAWKAKHGTAIQSTPDVHLFYARLAQRAAGRGWLRLHFLSVNQRRIAFDYSLLYNNRIFLLKPGYDPEYSQYSPYNLLCSMVIEQAFRDGVAEFDFLGVSEEWKRTWTERAQRQFWLYIFPDDVRSGLLHSAKFRLAPSLRKKRLYVALRAAVASLKGRGLSLEA